MHWLTLLFSFARSFMNDLPSLNGYFACKVSLFHPPFTKQFFAIQICNSIVSISIIVKLLPRKNENTESLGFTCSLAIQPPHTVFIGTTKRNFRCSYHKSVSSLQAYVSYFAVTSKEFLHITFSNTH